MRHAASRRVRFPAPRRGPGRGVFACVSRSGYDGGTFAGILRMGRPAARCAANP